MSRRLLPYAFLLTACSAPQLEPETAPELEGPPRYVIVRADAVLRATPEERALQAADTTVQPEDRGKVWRLVRNSQDWVQLESLPADRDGHCAGPERSLAGLAVRVWVRPTDLAPVLTQGVVQTWPDGTAILVQPGLEVGAPLGKTAADKLVVPFATSAYLSAVEAPVAAVGASYLPVEPPRPATETGESCLVRAGARLGLGAGQLLSRTADREHHCRRVGRDDGHWLVDLDARCVTFRVRVADTDVSSPANVFGLLGAGTGSAAWIRPGTRVFWPDGREAGFAVEAVAARSERAGSQGRRCFWFDLRAPGRRAPRLDPNAALPLCVEPGAVTTKHRP